MRNRVSIVLSYCCILLVFFSCSGTYNAPADLISKDKMTEMLVDIHLAEASTEARAITPDLIDEIAAERYKTIFEKYKVSYSDFKESFDYYVENSDQLDTIYYEVVSRLSTMDGKFNSIKKKNLNSRDSVLQAPVNSGLVK